MTQELIRCTTCKRHIFATEAACPFCNRDHAGAPLSVAVALAAASLVIAGCDNSASKSDMAPAAQAEQNKAAPAPIATEKPAEPKPVEQPIEHPGEAKEAIAPTPTASASAAAPAIAAPTPTARQITTTEVAKPTPKAPAAAYGGPPRRDPGSPR